MINIRSISISWYTVRVWHIILRLDNQKLDYFLAKKLTTCLLNGQKNTYHYLCLTFDMNYFGYFRKKVRKLSSKQNSNYFDPS